MKIFKRLTQLANNQVGASFAEVMLVSLLILSLTYTAAQVIQNMNTSTSGADRKLLANALASKIAETLRYESTCTASVGPSSGAPLAFNGTFSQTVHFAMKIKGIEAGVNMTDEIIRGVSQTNLPGSPEIPAMRVRVKELKLTDPVDIDTTPDPDPTRTPVLYTVRLTVTDLEGNTTIAEKIVGSIVLNVDVSTGTWSVANCLSPTVETLRPVCEGMGCTYDNTLNPPCRCRRSLAICSTPGYYPVAFKNGIPDCRPLGGDTCPGTTWLVGIGIERNICSPVPVTSGMAPMGSGSGASCLANGEDAGGAGQLCSTGGIGPRIPNGSCCSGFSRIICPAPNEPAENICSI